MMVHERLEYMDVAKCIAIFLVCIGHSYFLSPTGHSSIARAWIYSFHMPLFMLLCGFFSVNSFKLSFSALLIKKSRTLLLPIISFTLLSCIIYIIGDVPDLCSACRSELIGGMWFLRTLFFCYFIVYAVKKTRLPDWLCCLLSCLAFMAIPKGSFLQTNYLLLFFWTGYFTNKYKEKYYKYRQYVTAIALLAYVLFGRITMPEVLAYGLVGNLNAVYIQYITAISMSFVLMGFAYYFSRISSMSFIVRRMSKVGRYTLGIYGVQTILIERITYCSFNRQIIGVDAVITDNLLIPLIGILYGLFCYVLVWITSHSKTCNLLLYGNQYQ